MSAGLGTRPNATTYDIERLVGMVWEGRIRVPHFQRELRWGRKDVIYLFDSIVKGYPIGSLLLWVRPAPAERLHLGALDIDAPSYDQSLWVVDGQQRVMSLANALSEDGAQDPRFALSYDLREEDFVASPTVAEPHIVPLPTLFDLRKLLTWFAKYPNLGELQDRAFNLTTVLRQYPVPAYQVEQGETEVLQVIFDRMNNYGKRLSRAEIFSALNAGPEGVRSLTLSDLADHISNDLAFGQIDDDTVLYAVLARRGADVQRDIHLEFGDDRRRGQSEFPGEDRDGAYRAGEEALIRAVRFLQTDACVPHFTLLPYRYLLVVLARFFAHFPDPDPANRRLLRRWFWRAALVGPAVFRGSTTGAVRTLCGKIRAGDITGSVQDLLAAVDPPAAVLPDLRRFRTNEAYTKIALCSWWELSPRDPTTGAVTEIEDLGEQLADRTTCADAVRYIVPSRRVEAGQRLWAANRVLMPVMQHEAGRDVIDIFVNPPIALVGVLNNDEGDQQWQSVLASHLMSSDMVGLLRSGRDSEFLNRRQEAVIAHLDSFLRRKAEWGFEDTPPMSELLIEDLSDEERPLTDEESYGPA
ncbi:DUF262 domain-containing protein [Nocardia sp. ET3-3]|uniref:DUF262 domain-containing protein n=1 Tax=Nocardia terrae TaxID=2675851 RepID=A0A7K1V2C1_9NOCA|nr:DUF262 domain-containing protein [Nocardia terrae]MVU80278.1 DUF262 domain-containing protein [Nocardia terrae]